MSNSLGTFWVEFSAISIWKVVQNKALDWRIHIQVSDKLLKMMEDHLVDSGGYKLVSEKDMLKMTEDWLEEIIWNYTSSTSPMSSSDFLDNI